MKNVIVTGATGMIGSLILQKCLESDEISKVTSLVRKNTGVTNSKLREIVIRDFKALEEEADYFTSVDIVYYCLGVYTGAVDRDRFRQITVDFPEHLAQVLQKKSQGIRFCLLSGAGADRSERSRMMFAKDKGIIENRLSQMGFEAFHAFRPGYIYPVASRSEPNLSYTVMRYLYPLIKLFGNNASVRSTDLAEVMFKVGITGYSKEILENRDIVAAL